MSARNSVGGMENKRRSASGVPTSGASPNRPYVPQNATRDMMQQQSSLATPTQQQAQQTPQQQQAAQQQRRASRGSVSGTSFGKPDYNQPVAAPAPIQDRRASKRLSRLSKLSDVSEAESNKSNSRVVSTAGMSVADTVAEDDSVHPLPPMGRRMSRRVSVADDFAAESERRRSRRLSLLSSGSSVARMSAVNRAQNDWVQGPESGDATTSWSEDYKNPVNWTFQMRMWNTIVACIIAFSYIMSITCYGFAIDRTVVALKISPLLAAIPYALFALGLAFGHFLATSIADAYGRRIVLLSSIPAYAVLMVGAGLVHSITGLILLRFFSAVFASPGLFTTYSIVSDMWIASRHSFPVSLFAAAIVGGAVVGPVVAGVAEQFENYHWAMWLPCFTVIALLFGTIGSSETEKSMLIRMAKTPAQKQQELEKKRQVFLERQEKKLPPLPKEKVYKFSASNAFIEPFKLLITQPRHMLSSIYTAYVFAVILVLPVVIPAEFGNMYSFNFKQQGLTFIGMCIGVLVAIAFAFIVDKFIHQPRVRRWAVEQEIIANEEGHAEITENREGGLHSSWRQGLTGMTASKLGISPSTNTSARNSTQSIGRSGSDSSASGARNSTISNHRNSTGSRASRRSRLVAFSERNINIAIVATRYLNSIPANTDKKIIVERVMVLLKDNESFTGICQSLEQLGLEFEEALFAKVVEDALIKEKGHNGDIALARSKSLHRLAAQAALMGPTDSSGDEASPTSAKDLAVVDEPRTPAKQNGTKSSANSANGPRLDPAPAEWRYTPALPATLLFPASLIFIGWTVKASIPWYVPVIGMGLFGFSAAVLVWATTAYGMELFAAASAARFTSTDARGEQDSAHALRAGTTLITFVLAGIFPIFAKPMFSALGFAWGTSVFGFVAFAAGVVPWVLVLSGKKLNGKIVQEVESRRFGAGIEKDESALPTVPKGLA